MKKIIMCFIYLISLIIVLFFININFKNNNKNNNINSNNNNQLTSSENKNDSTNNNDEDNKIINEDILSIPDKLKNYFNYLDNNIILQIEDIYYYNEIIKSKTNTIYDIYNISSISKEDIKNYINNYKIPTLPKYNNNKKITSNEINNILENRNLNNIKDQKNIIKGLVIKRSNLRSFPTNIHFYNSASKTYLDNIQETELLVNSPVLILHESKDGLWYFVLSLTYYGWVEKDTIAYATDDDWNYFLNNDNSVVITDNKIETDNTVLDMSVKLPYTEMNNEFYKIVLPNKGNNNYVEKKEFIISRDKAYPGYLPYTKRNIYMQALKYEGIKYQWGGYTGGVDCSSYVSNVFRCFGFQFPRNTSSQNESVGKIISLSNKSNTEKLKLIEQYPTALLYQSGHVMIYLGIYNNKHYIIHANGSTLDVAITVLENSKYLSNINKIVLIK